MANEARTKKPVIISIESELRSKQKVSESFCLRVSVISYSVR